MPPRPDAESRKATPSEAPPDAPQPQAVRPDTTDADRTTEWTAPPAECANCGADLHGPYCSRCGQRNVDLAVSLKTLARDFADEYFSLDSRLFRSIVFLLFRPGFLTRQYLIGRRERYVRPLRLYVVASLLFFFVLSVFARPAFLLDIADPGRPIRELIEAAMEDEAPLVEEQPTADTPRAAVDSPPIVAPQPVPPTPDVVRVAWWDVPVRERFDRLQAMTPRQLMNAFATGLERHLPRMMFVLLPVFALLLKLLYIRRRWYYAEHFVFALHVHAFAFSIFLLVLLLPQGWWIQWLSLWGALYLFLAMHRVYRQQLWRTAVKFALLSSVYFVTLSLAVAASIVLTVLLI